jgi:alpha-2-macroglobulin
VLVDLLPAGWEIEAVITKPETYGFLAPLSQPKIAEARDDRFVAALDLGADLNGGKRRRFSFREQDDNAKQLPAAAFHVAYLVRVVTPGSFALPEAVIEDMYRPGVMARTDAGVTSVAPR